MGILGTAMAGGIGDGMQMFAQTMAANSRADEDRALQRERLSQQREEFLARLQQDREIADMRYGEDSPSLAARGSGSTRGGKAGASSFESRPDLYGANAEKTDRAGFVSEETTTSRGDVGPDSFDPRIRREGPLNESITTKFDQAGYDKAEKARILENRRGKAMVDSPDKYDDLEKGIGTASINDIISRANAAKTKEERDDLVTQANQQAMAKDGKERFKVSGNTVIDTTTGDNTATAVGESMAEKNSRAPTGKGGGGGSGAGADARALVNSLRTQESNISKNIAKLQEGFVTPAKQSQIDALNAERKDIQTRLRTAEEKLGGAAPAGGGAPAKAQAGGVPAPTSKADFDKIPKGTRYKAPDGSIRIKG